MSYYDIFCAEASRERHIRGIPGWRNRVGGLNQNLIKDHINMLADRDTGTLTMLGVVGGDRTRFQLLDLDLHGGDEGGFLEQAQILLEHHYGKNGWHAIVADEDANGIHLLRAFPDPVPTISAARYRRIELMKLDEAHPELADAARRHGMKTLGELEIYPNPDNGIRLPLCAGRTVLIDRPLELVTNRRGRPVQDVEAYVEWLLDPDKNYMAGEEVLDFLKDRLKSCDAKSAKKPTPKRPPNNSKPSVATKKVRRKGRQAPLIHEFWDKGQSALSLNEAINDMARILKLHPDFRGDRYEAAETIEAMVEDLPNSSISQRLSAEDWCGITRVIDQSVENAFDGNKGQPAPQESTRKWKAACQHWSRIGYLPWDKASRLTFARLQHPEYSTLDFSEEHLYFIEQVLCPLLQTDMDTAQQLMQYFLNFVFHHPGEISTKQLLRQILHKFGISAGSDKLTAFMRYLREAEWIYIKTKEQRPVKGKKGRARSYGLGAATVALFKNTKAPETNNTNPLPPAHLLLRPGDAQ